MYGMCVSAYLFISYLIPDVYKYMSLGVRKINEKNIGRQNAFKIGINVSNANTLTHTKSFQSNVSK